MYGVLGAITARSWLRSNRAPAAFIVLALALCVGAADEVHQRSVAGRSSELADFVADTAGVLIGFTLVARRRASLITGNE
jgi:VanZ family protein